jgi:hypothetical protein
MLVALSPSIHRLRMSSLDYHGDATSSHNDKKTTPIAQRGANTPANSADMTTTMPQGRPKLSLQTSSLPSPYAKSSKDVLGSTSVLTGTATPTTSNTIANSVQAIPLRPSPSTPRSSFSKLSRSRPYTQPIGLRSIMKNAPDSPKLGMKRSHSLFSADSGSPHTTRRMFFPPVKKVKFEGDEKLVVEIPSKERSRSPEVGSSETEPETREQKSTTSEDDSGDQAEGEHSTLIVKTSVEPAPRTRNGTPPPEQVPLNKKRKFRKWEWTIESARQPEGDPAV